MPKFIVHVYRRVIESSHMEVEAKDWNDLKNHYLIVGGDIYASSTNLIESFDKNVKRGNVSGYSINRISLKENTDNKPQER